MKKFNCFTCFTGLTSSLAQSAMFRLYLAFMIFMDCNISQVKIFDFLAFLECLNFNGVKASQMNNYVSAIKSYYVRFALSVSVFDSPQIAMYIKSLQKTAPFKVKIPNLVDINLLRALIAKCDCTYMGAIFKTVYLLGFFGFLRLSNLVPHSLNLHSHLKQLSKGDFFFINREAIILLKWTKTLRMHNQAKLLKIPILNYDLCPVRAIKNCLKLVPGGSNAPIFQFNLFGKWIPLTDTRVKKHLKNILSLLGLDPDFVTFHSFRRSGATFAFNHKVPLQDIQRHGTWTSDCVWRYVTDSADCGSQVASTFATLLS